MFTIQFCPEESEHMKEMFSRLQAGEVIANEPFKFYTKTGAAKYLLVDCNVSRDSDGDFRHFRCFIRDDTERRIQAAVAEAEMNKLSLVSAAKDKFVRRIFHEIRTPLHIMYSALKNHIDENASNLRPLSEHSADLRNQVSAAYYKSRHILLQFS